MEECLREGSQDEDGRRRRRSCKVHEEGEKRKQETEWRHFEPAYVTGDTSSLLMLQEACLLSKDWAEDAMSLEITCPDHACLCNSRKACGPRDWPSSLAGNSCADSSPGELREISQPPLPFRGVSYVVYVHLHLHVCFLGLSWLQWGSVLQNKFRVCLIFCFCR